MLKIGYLNLDNPVAIISSNGKQSSHNGSAGLLMLGIFDLDRFSQSEVERAIEEVGGTNPLGFSVTGGSREELISAANLAAKRRYLLEIDGSGHSDEIADLLSELKKTGATISVRFRPDSEDVKEFVKRIKEAGVDLVHLDLSGQGAAAEKLVKKVSDAGSPKVMARYDVADFEGAKSILSMGADMVSLNDGSDPEFVTWLTEVLKEFQRLVGWYNAPKHICSRGDLRGVAFCCPPVKNCPLLGALRKIDMTPKEFVEKKMGLANGTPLQHGDGTCFGSLVWCCKVTKPCFMRDAVLDRIGLSPSDYMRLKKKLAEDILEA